MIMFEFIKDSGISASGKFDKEQQFVFIDLNFLWISDSFVSSGIRAFSC